MTDDSVPLAVFEAPPLTAELVPLAMFEFPPLTEEVIPLTALFTPPLTTDASPVVLLLRPFARLHLSQPYAKAVRSGSSSKAKTSKNTCMPGAAGCFRFGADTLCFTLQTDLISDAPSFGKFRLGRIIFRLQPPPIAIHQYHTVFYTLKHA